MSASQPGPLVPVYEAAATELVRIWKLKNGMDSLEREGWSDHFGESPHNIAAHIIDAALPALAELFDRAAS